MSNFKTGQKVVCIKYDNILKCSGDICPAPNINDIVTIIGISEGWLIFEEYGFDYEYEPYNFRPLDNKFAEDVIKMICEQSEYTTL